LLSEVADRVTAQAPEQVSQRLLSTNIAVFLRARSQTALKVGCSERERYERT
jgi:hypothetical protein